MKVFRDRTVDRNEGLDERQSEVVAGGQLVLVLVADVIEIEIARRIAPKINAGQQRQPATNALDVSRLTAENVARLALLNQTVTEVRAQGKSVVAEES